MTVFSDKFNTPTIVSNNPDGTGNLVILNGHNTCRINGNTGQSCTMELGIPRDYLTADEAIIIISAPAAGGTLRVDVVASFGTLGELGNNSAPGVTPPDFITINAELIPVNITALLNTNGLAALDLLGVTISDQNLAGSANVHVYCTVLRYNR